MIQLTIPEVGPDPDLPVFDIRCIEHPDDIPAWLPERLQFELEDAETTRRDYSWYRDGATFLAVKLGDDIKLHRDGVLNDDCTFLDGWSWVEPALRAAYELGRASASLPTAAGSDNVI